MDAEFPDEIPGPKSIDCPDCGEEIEALPMKCSACGCPLWAGVLAGAIQMSDPGHSDRNRNPSR